MQDDDYFTMKNLMRGYLQETSFNSGELVDLMLAQKEKIGSSITVVGQEEMFGFMSIIGLEEHWGTSCVQSIIKYVLGRVGTSSQVEEWKKILSKKESKVGLILSERIANLPDHLAPHLALLTLGEVGKLDPSPNYNYYLVVTNTYKQGVEEESASPMDDPDQEDGSGPSKKEKRRKTRELQQQQQASGGLDPTVHYYKPEDEIFKASSLLSHSTRVVKNNQQNRWTLHMYTQQSKLFLLIAADQLPRIVSSLKTMASVMDKDLKEKQEKETNDAEKKKNRR
jgi:hypothetical protein